MPDYRRHFQPGGTYFFTLNLKNRRSDLLTRRIGFLRESWRDVRVNQPFTTIAAAVLPDHLHMVIALPPDDQRFPDRIRLLKSGFTRRLPNCEKSTGRKGERGVWQSRYWEHMIRDERDLQVHVDYVHNNPVKHGYVADVAAWPYSTWHRYRTWLVKEGSTSSEPPDFGEP
jgi:putative transposase